MFSNRNNKAKEELLEKFGDFKDDSFDFKQIEEYFRKKDNSNAFQSLSDKTCNDINFQELFMFIDRTNSKVGQQFLYNKLRTIPLDSEDNNVHENLMDELTNNSDFRVFIQSQLSKLNDRDAYYITSLFQDGHLKPPKWFNIIRILSYTIMLLLIMLFFKSVVFFVLLGVFIINIGIHYWNKRNLYQYLSSLPQLLRLNSIACELFKNDSLKEIDPTIQESIRIIDKDQKSYVFLQIGSKIAGRLRSNSLGNTGGFSKYYFTYNHYYYLEY